MNTSSGHGRSRRRDRGETLLELLVTITIMGIGVTAILGAVGMGISASARVRSDSTLVAAMRSYGEVLSNFRDSDYVACADSTKYDIGAKLPSGRVVAVPLPSGTTVDVSLVEYWNGTTYTKTCPATDTGLQRVTLSGTDSRVSPTVTGTLVVYVRKPCTSAATTC